MLETLKIIGTVAAGVAVVGTTVWSFWRFFLFATLARVFTVSIESREFARTDSISILVAARLTNASKVRTDVHSISFRPLFTVDSSPEAREIALKTTPWQRLGGQAGDRWNPGESHQTVFEVPWPKGQISAPLQFKFEFVESIDAEGIVRMIQRVLFSRKTSGSLQAITVYQLLTRP